MIRVFLLLFAIGLAPAAADDLNCTNCYQEGLDARTRSEPDLAMRLFKHGCEQDDGASCLAAAYMISREEVAPKENEGAFSFAVRGCDLGHAQACRDIGVNMVRSEKPEIAADGRVRLTQACDGGNAAGCGALGNSMVQGYGGPIDQARGTQLIHRSCDLGYAAGCSGYGVSLFTGDGADPILARVLVKRGCDGGDAKGCGYLGAALRDGFGGSVDAVAANQYFERACKAGVTRFCSDLAIAYYYGTGDFEVDRAHAVTLFQTACDGGHEMACEKVDLIAKAGPKKAPAEQSAGLSMSMENVSFSTRKKPADDNDWQASTTIGSMKIGQGSETATFSNVRSSCGMLQLTLAFGSAAAPLRRCLNDSDTRDVSLVIEDGRIASSSVDPDDAVGSCVTNALGRAHIDGLSCRLDAGVSR